LPLVDTPPHSAYNIALREQTLESQRTRMLDAMAEIVADRGLRGVTIAAVAKQACVSRATFIEVFGSVEQAFIALVGDVTRRSADLIREAFRGEPSWSEGVLAGLEALLRFLDSEPSLARVCLIEAQAGPPAALELRAQLLQPLAAIVDEAREMLPADGQPPAVIGEGTVMAVAGILHTRLVTRRAPPFTDLLGELAAIVVAPFLGPSAASEVARIGNQRARSIARERTSGAGGLKAPIPKQLRRASARRARACLLYIAENPGRSNQKIARGIDVSHGGQMSVLLSRLEQLLVLTKQTGGAGRPNAWRLSPYGEEVVRSLKLR
jgi:AcrR family transcriptional regulator